MQDDRQIEGVFVRNENESSQNGKHLYPSSLLLGVRLNLVTDNVSIRRIQIKALSLLINLMFIFKLVRHYQANILMLTKFNHFYQVLFVYFLIFPSNLINSQCHPVTC